MLSFFNIALRPNINTFLPSHQTEEETIACFFDQTRLFLDHRFDFINLYENLLYGKHWIREFSIFLNLILQRDTFPLLLLLCFHSFPSLFI